MKIILSADAITPKLTGIGHYTLALAKGLPKHPIIDKQYLCSAGMITQDYNFLLKHDRKGVFARETRFRAVARNIYHWINPKILSIWLKFLSIDVYHAPNFILQNINLPSVATVHDLTFIHYPQFLPKDRLDFLTQQLPKTLSRAAHIITDTEYVRGELIERFDISPEKITAIPLGVDESFKPRKAVDVQPVIDQYQLNYGQYLLAVATIEPRKNFSNLLTAFCSLPVDLKKRFPLVLVGDQGWLSKELHQKIITLSEKGYVKYLNYIDDNTLKHLYSGARGVAYPSFYEGFGLPVIEAMASGTLILTSDTPSLKEVAGKTAILVNPEQVDNIKLGLIELLTLDEPSRQTKINAGLSFSSQFTWHKCIEKTVAVYQKVMK